MTELVAVDQICQVFCIYNKLQRTLRDTAIHQKRARQLSIYAESLWVLTKIWLAPIQRPASDGQTPVYYLQQYLVVDGVKPCSEVQKDDSADIASIYRLDNLVMHGSDSGFCRVVGSVRRLSNREKLLWLDMMSETVCCYSLTNLRQKCKVRYRPVGIEVV